MDRELEKLKKKNEALKWALAKEFHAIETQEFFKDIKWLKKLKH